jgi:hypothetical protein
MLCRVVTNVAPNGIPGYRTSRVFGLARRTLTATLGRGYEGRAGVKVGRPAMRNMRN